jgi:epsilon-lactone hydrolase
MALTRGLLRLRAARPSDDVAMRLAIRSRPGAAPVSAPLRRACTVKSEQIAGRSVVTLTPRRNSTGVQLVYLHGGAYIGSLVPAHWRIIRTLIEKTGATVTVPFYGLAPEETVGQAFEFLDFVYAAVRERAGEHGVVLAGDSAGAALAVGEAIRCRDAGTAPPSALILFSPWVDATMTNPDIGAVAPRDPSLIPARLVVAGAWWAGDRPTSDPLVSPINDSLRGLPPMYVYQGGRDVFLPDASLFVAKVTAAGGTAVLRVYPTGFHVFMGASWTPEARNALSDAAQRIDAVA